MANGDAGKVSQEECNYRKGTPMKHCGICVYYEGASSGTCTKVAGDISGFGISDIFEMQKSPWPSTIGPREAAMIEQATQSPKDQSPMVQSRGPTTRIGNRSYGGRP